MSWKKNYKWKINYEKVFTSNQSNKINLSHWKDLQGFKIHWDEGMEGPALPHIAGECRSV